MHAIEVSTTFSAAHALRLPGGGVEPLHGHDFNASVTLTCNALDALDTVIDFHIIEKHLDAIVSPWRSRNLNDIEPFKSTINPSAERIAQYLGESLQRLLLTHNPDDVRTRGLEVNGVRLSEAPGCFASWVP